MTITARTYTRRGYADIRLFGLQLSAINYHASRPDIRWHTGITTDLRTWKPGLHWFVDVALLGFSIGACSTGQHQ